MTHEEMQERLDEIKSKYPDSLPTLVGVDGNAFAVLGHFSRNAKKAGWDKKDIEKVNSLATSGDYTRLLYVISTYTD